MNIDKLMDLNFGFIKLMPIIEHGGAVHAYKNLSTSCQLPKNMITEELRVNEKFLNKYLCLVEDNLSKKQLDNFIEYQNWNFQHGMGISEKNQHQYTDVDQLAKENLFSNVNVKTKKELQKTRILV